MSEEEIISAREELLSALSPSMIEFFNNKRNKNTTQVASNKISIKNDVVSKIDLNSSIENNNTSELAKQIPFQTSISKSSSSEINTIVSSMFDPIKLRFDLQGRVIKELDQELLPTHLGLHHNEENKAGYALQDIKILLR